MKEQYSTNITVIMGQTEASRYVGIRVGRGSLVRG